MLPDIHMTPDEGMRAHLDLQGGEPGGVLLPIHWGTFNLAPHAWVEPGEWVMDAAEPAGRAAGPPVPVSPSSRPRSFRSTRGGERCPRLCRTRGAVRRER